MPEFAEPLSSCTRLSSRGDKGRKVVRRRTVQRRLRLHRMSLFRGGDGRALGSPELVGKSFALRAARPCIVTRDEIRSERRARPFLGRLQLRHNYTDDMDTRADPSRSLGRS